MFFDHLDEILKIAKNSGTAVIVVPDETEVEIRNALTIEPEEKASITIAQAQGMMESLQTRQTEDRYVIIRPAERLGEEAANAILKTLEEPPEKMHFLLVTSEPSALLTTIRSRAKIYVWRGGLSGVTEIKADEKVKILAKKLLAAKPAELPALAEEVAKKKDGVRKYALDVLGVTIEMAYKSYFMTGKTVFLTKIPKFLAAYQGISANGHVKLHLVADLI